MKHSIIFIFFLLIAFMLACSLFGCETPRQQHSREREELKVTKGLGDDYFYIIDIMDCNYIIYHGNNKGTIIHAANCQNHKIDAELDAGAYPPKKPVQWISGSDTVTTKWINPNK